MELVYTIQNALLQKGAPAISGTVRVRLRDFCHAILRSPVDDRTLACAMFALRTVGDASSLNLIRGARPLDEVWKDAPKQAVRAIRKRRDGGMR